ncbi:MAG TPA: diguanylate cyclase [Nitrospiria bacterium]|nr:diguanylate cyclase [Nitrospiria bacterium]
MDSEAWAHWRELQDGIAAATGLSLITYNVHGRVSLSAPACEPSHDHPVCGLLQHQYGHAASCHAHCGKQVSAAAERQEPVVFTCYAGLQAFAMPVIHSSTDRVVLLGGKRFTSFDAIARLRDLADRLPGDLTPLLDELRRSRVTDTHVLTQSAGLAEKIGRTFFDNISLRNRSELKLSRLLTLLSLFEEIRDEESRRQLYALVLNALGVLFGVRTAAVFVLNSSAEEPAGAPSASLTPVELFGDQRDRFAGLRINLAEGLFRRFLDNPKPTSCEVVFELLKSGLPDTVTSVHLFALTRGTPPQTVLALFNTPMTDDDLSLVGSFCTHFSLTLENQALQQRLNHHRAHVAALVAAIERIGKALDATELCETIVNEVTRLVGAEQGSLMMLDHKHRALVIKAITGVNRKIVEQIRVLPGDGIAGKVFATGTPLVVGDLETDGRVQREKRPRYKTKSFASLPMKLDNRIIGVLNLADKTSGGGFADEEIALISTLVTCASVAIERAEFLQQTEALKRISITDALTGFLNRRYFHERLIEEIERSKRHATTLSLAIMDLDDFKLLNDTYGHQAGDEALKAVARCVHGSIRAIDVAARYGGEEFTLILPQTSKPEASRIAQRICDEVAAMTISHPLLGGYGRLTISIGLAAYPDDANTPEGLVRCADTALYMAKDRGKNRVMAYGES